MKVAFHTNEINVRGTELAAYKYAHYNEKLLGNESISPDQLRQNLNTRLRQKNLKIGSMFFVIINGKKFKTF